MKIITIKTYTTRIQAELAKGVLEAEGVPVIIRSDDEGGMMAYPFSFIKGVQLQIRESDKEKAEKILKEFTPN